jgi:partner of Y14 and mago
MNRSVNRVRKQIKIRPGFTPQEDVRRFRGTKQAQMDVNALPKGHIIGWTPPPSTKSAANGGSSGEGGKKSAAAKKNEKRRAKKAAEKAEVIKDSWEDDDEEVASSNIHTATTSDPGPLGNTSVRSSDSGRTKNETTQQSTSKPSANGLADQLEKLNI